MLRRNNPNGSLRGRITLFKDKHFGMVDLWDTGERVLYMRDYFRSPKHPTEAEITMFLLEVPQLYDLTEELFREWLKA